MTKERELLRRALEDWDFSDKFETLDPIFEDIRTYLSNSSDDAEEPVKCKRCNGTGVVDDGWIDCYPDGTPYVNAPIKCVKDCPDCHPPKPAEPARKPWQGLDEDEVEEILEGFPMGTYSEQAFAQAIEQELKERNT